MDGMHRQNGGTSLLCLSFTDRDGRRILISDGVE